MSGKIRSGSVRACAAILICTLVLSLHAQVTTGSISGVVRDDSGGIISGAEIAITNSSTGLSRSGQTDAAGRFVFPQLPIGPYEVQATMTGFQTAVQRGIQLTVGRQATLDIVLKVGAVAERVEVTSEAPLVESQSATISNLVESQTVSDLPLNGRSFDQLITLTPGTLGVRSKGSSTMSGFGAIYSVAGARHQSNKFMVDGTEMLGGGANSSNAGSVSGENLGVEALAEFRVLTNNYGAEYGKKAGGTVNVSTKAGTNQFHGSLFEFLRNDNLDAREYFAEEKGEFRRNNFGGSGGGPIVRDRLFVFGAYEGLREDLASPVPGFFPDEAAHRGFVPGAAGAAPRFVGVDPRIKPYLDLYPIPSGASQGDGSAEHIVNGSRDTREDFFTTRADYQLRESDSLWGVYRFDDAFRNTVDNNPNFFSPEQSRLQMITLQETHIFSPTVLNVFRVGFGRWAGIIDALVPVDGVNAPSFAPSLARMGQLVIGGAASGSNAITNLGPTSPYRVIVNNTFEYEDQLTLNHLNHSGRVGVHVQRLQKNIDGPTTRFGRYNFTSLENFLLARPGTFTGPAPNSVSPRGFRQTLLATYFQDDWSITPRLTLNLGLRYETLSSPFEVNGQISNWVEESVNGLRRIQTQPSKANPPYANNSKTAFAPRFGMAWRATEDGKTVIRGGGGIFYDHLLDWFGFFLTSNPPFNTINIANPPFPSPFTATGTSPTPQVRGSAFDLDVPTRLQYNLQVQQEFSNSMVLSVGYVGSSSYHLTRSVNANTAYPSSVAGDGTKFFAAGLPRRNPALGTTGRFIVSDANARYHSLQMDFRSRLIGGLRFQTNYTLSKSVDDSSLLAPGEANGELGSPQDPDIRDDRGLSLFDVRQNFSSNFNYDLPFGRGLSGWQDKFFGGWQANGILSIHSGTPFTPGAGFNNSRNGDANAPDRPHLFAGASKNPVLGGPDLYFDPMAFELAPAGFYGNLGRGTVIGPGFTSVDVSMFKNTQLRENVAVQFRAEVFNLLNHGNFALPSNVLFSTNRSRVGSAGRVNDTTTSARQLQFGLKLLW